MSHKSPPEGTLEPPALHMSANNNVQGNVHLLFIQLLHSPIYYLQNYFEIYTPENDVQGIVHLQFLEVVTNVI